MDIFEEKLKKHLIIKKEEIKDKLKEKEIKKEERLEAKTNNIVVDE